jgi:hypothetical protein
MKAACSYEMTLHFLHTTRRYILENRTLHNGRCENFESYTWSYISKEQ